MSDYIKSNIGSGYNSATNINTELGKIETAIASKVDEEGGVMTGDLQMNSNDILNAGQVSTNTLILDGVALTANNPVNSDTTVTTTRIVATAGQTVFTVPSYSLGINAIQVFLNGVKLSVATDYAETNTTTITLTNGASVNDVFEALIGATVTDANNYDSALVTYNQGATGAVNRNVQQKLSETVSVLDFGAVGDGVTDDTSAIQAAIDYAETQNVINYKGGARVYIPQGTYHISSTLTLGRNKLCQLVGEGQQLTTLSYTGSGTALSVSGTQSGDNQSFYMADLQITNDATAGTGAGGGTGLRGFEGNFIAFSGTLARVLVKGFLDENFWIENFENGCLFQTRSEKLTETKVGVYLKNTNGVMILGHQCHGPGDRSGNSPVGTAFASYTGSVCFYADNVEAANFQSLVLEGGTTNSDVGLWLEEPADRPTPRGGINIYGAYIERCSNGMVFRGFDSNTELRNIDIRGGKIGGGTPDRGIVAGNYVENVSIDKMEIVCSAGNHTIFDSTCSDIHIGRLSYQNSAEGGNQSSYSMVSSGINMINSAGGHAGIDIVYSVDNQTSNGTATDYDAPVVTGDYRRPRAVIFNSRITVNTPGSSGTANMRIFPTGGGVNTYCNHRVSSSSVAGDEFTQQFIVPVSSSGQIRYQSQVTSGVGWDVDFDLVKVGVIL